MGKKRLLASALLATFTISAALVPLTNAEASTEVIKHTVIAGDTPWLLSRQYQVSLDELLALNGFNDQVVIYIGDQLKIPHSGPQPQLASQADSRPEPASRSGPEGPRITFTQHTIVKGESMWSISNQYGIPLNELLQANNLTARSVLHVGQSLQVPVYHIPQSTTVSSQHGELLDWWTESQYLWPIGVVATVTDYYTKQSWQVVRSYGASHADVEPLTAKDAAIMKSVWGGNWSWTPRPVIVEVNGRRIAASANGMPHSIQTITDNNFNGHSCIHFLNSRQHNTNAINPSHQRAVNIAAGK